MPVQGALTGAEHIRTAAAANLANQIATMSCAADDLFERHTVADESRNYGIASPARQVAPPSCRGAAVRHGSAQSADSPSNSAFPQGSEIPGRSSSLRLRLGFCSWS